MLALSLTSKQLQLETHALYTELKFIKQIKVLITP